MKHSPIGKTALVAAITFMFLALTAVVGCGSQPQSAATKSSEKASLETVGTLSSKSVSDSATASPSVAGAQDATAASEVSEGKTVVCIGDSITAGHTYSSDHEPWPTYLQERLTGLGDQWAVVNLGVSGTTLLDEGVYPYRSTGYVDEAKKLAPDMAVIMLGTNDSANPNLDTDSFRTQLEALVAELRSAQPSLRVVLMAPPHVQCGPGDKYSMNDSVIGNEIRPIVREVAAATGSQFIDLYALSDGHDEWFPDTVHPSNEGNRVIANYIFEEVFQ